MQTKIENANAYRRRRNSQIKWCMFLVLLAAVCVAYLMYKPSKAKAVQGNKKPQSSKIVQSNIKDVDFNADNDIFEDDYYETTTYGGFMHMFTTTFGNWQDIAGRPHYRAWDFFSTTNTPDMDTDDVDGQNANAEVDKKEETLPQIQPPKDATESTLISKIKPSDDANSGKVAEKPKETYKVLVGDTLLKMTDPLKVTKLNFLDEFKNPCFHRKDTEAGEPILHCLPSFFIVGMPRSGTGDLYIRLSNHPNVVQSERNAPSWWMKTSKNPVTFAAYLEHFKVPSKSLQNLADMETRQGILKHNSLIFDSSPSMFWKGNIIEKDNVFMTPAHLKQVLPDAKIIVLVRNPTERLYSEFYHLNPKATPEKFDAFAKSSINAYTECEKQVNIESTCVHKNLDDDTKAHLETGMYSVFYQEWRKSFPGSQIMVIRVEDYGKELVKSMSMILKFLQISDLPDRVFEQLVGDQFKMNRNLDRPAMKASTGKLLNDFYSLYNRRLAKELQDSKFEYANK